MIEITFGMALDGARWTEKGASIGKMTCGPLGMLKFLETRLGLGGVEVPQAERIGAYLEKVRAVYGMIPDAWGAESFKKDYWTTTKRLLAWRDELVDAGWDGKQGGSDRLDVLAKIESAGDPTPAGLPDRVKRAVQTCTKEALSGVAMTLVDDLDKYPHHWRMFFKKLGIASQWKIPKRPEHKVDGKDLVDEVVAANEIQLAGLFVMDLRARLEDQKRVAIIAEGDTGILDEFLHRAGLPSIGRSQSSAERAAIQILPLWIKYMWKPFDPMTLLAILKSEVSPFIPGRKENDKFKPVGLRIVKALRESPGIGGEEWYAAWEEIGPDFAEYRKVLETQRFDPEGDGVPYEELVKRIDWLVAKLGPKVADDFKFLDGQAKGMLKRTIQNAKLMQKLAKSLEKIDRVALQRLLETIVATGCKMPGARHEVAPWRVYTHPGQIAADVDCVLWWDFCDSGHGTGTYWTNEERTALGGDVDFDAENSLARESDGWYNALVRAKKEFKLYHPMTAFGETCGDHPFRADLIHYKYIKEEEPVVRECDSEAPAETENSDGETKETNVSKVPPSKDLKPGSVSATQLSTLLSCPFKWYLEKHLNLREQDALALPTGAPMVGTLAHKVVEMLIKHHNGVNSTEAGALAERYFDELVSQMAAELEAPDRTVELDYYRSTLKESVETLWWEVEKRGLRFVAAEKKLDKEGAFHGLDFIGSADIVLEDGAGCPYVIDLKWSAGSRYIEAAENGRSVQLATYSWAIDPANIDVKSAYYLFPKKKFYENPQDDREVWRKIQTDYARTVAEMQSGELHRGYEKGETALGLEPPCNFCSFKALCGKERK